MDVGCCLVAPDKSYIRHFLLDRFTISRPGNSTKKENLRTTATRLARPMRPATKFHPGRSPTEKESSKTTDLAFKKSGD
ncbi:hypothetical protein KEM48_002247 [Puccinia striiformis f. sp. tritici PST-130]|nr:hypothetical protein KEM48_002247 [Puccinia striiformis f. sp. tritici PST-130]